MNWLRRKLRAWLGVEECHHPRSSVPMDDHVRSELPRTGPHYSSGDSVCGYYARRLCAIGNVDETL